MSHALRIRLLSRDMTAARISLAVPGRSGPSLEAVGDLGRRGGVIEEFDMRLEIGSHCPPGKYVAASRG